MSAASAERSAIARDLRYAHAAYHSRLANGDSPEKAVEAVAFVIDAEITCTGTGFIVRQKK